MAFRLAVAAAITTIGPALANEAPNAPSSQTDPEAMVQALIAFAEQGDPEGQFLLGSWYDTGEHVEEDDAEAVRWYRLAAEQGLAMAQLNLGVMYDNGEGVPEDHAEAARWYRLAAEQGHPKAQLNVALQYITGQGAPVDHVRAFAWLDLGAARGDPDAPTIRDSLADAMTPEQIAEARNLARQLADRVPRY